MSNYVCNVCGCEGEYVEVDYQTQQLRCLCEEHHDHQNYLTTKANTILIDANGNRIVDADDGIEVIDCFEIDANGNRVVKGE